MAATGHPDLALLTTSQMRAAERAAFTSGLPSSDAMQRAGLAVADALIARWRNEPGVDVHVLCGPGNNGGDGFIAAAVLKRAGYRVTLHALKPKSDYKGDAAEAAAGWDGEVRAPDPSALSWLGPSAIIVDALFGIGLDRALEGDAAAMINAVNRSSASVIAVDLPSGVNADDGRIMGVAIDADVTVTFGWRKRGHVLQPGAAQCGALVIADVGFSAADLGETGCWLNAPALWSSDYPMPSATKHKYDRGHAMIVGGGVMTGAARLAARAARRTGIGVLTLAVPTEVWAIYAADQPGAIVRPANSAAEFAALAGDERVSALLIGSGLEQSDATNEFVRDGIALGKPTVLDGGALTPLLGDGALTAGRADLVLTPQEGEFGRMFPDLVAMASKIARAEAAAARTGCTIILKGSDTVIAAPEGGVIVAAGATPTLATAGSGDVLAGIVAGLLALRMPPFAAAAMGVWLHARAAGGFGLGLIAEDLPDRLPGALAAALAP